MKSTILSDGWKLRQIPVTKTGELSVPALLSGTEGWIEIPAMPAMVHSILQDAGKIRTPWLPGAARECLWVAESDWVYALTFNPGDIKGPCRLRFRGLDTIVDIHLDGQIIASTQTMYNEVLVPVDLYSGSGDPDSTASGEHSLVLHFRSVFETADGRATPVLCVDHDETRPVRRSVLMNYNDYIGAKPWFSRVGVFGDILLESELDSEIRECHATASVPADLKSAGVKVSVSGCTGKCTAGGLELRLADSSGRVVASRTLPLGEGDFSLVQELWIQDPELWWPRGYGPQNLYTLTVQLVPVPGTGGAPVLDEKKLTIGFRRISMDKPLQFEVNGVPVRLWGGNWVIPHATTAVRDPVRTGRLLDMAEHANFNAFRVWGIPESPDDFFYEEADRRGFFLWQDFTDLPLKQDETSIRLCREESRLLVKRLSHHPAVGMWCGGNENAMWHHEDFGGPGGPWPGQYAAETVVGEVCAELDPERVFLPDSPYYGIDPNDPAVWDTHGYDNAWFVPGYSRLVFASEDTRISAPPVHSLKRFFADGDLWPEGYTPLFAHGCTEPWPQAWNAYTGHIAGKKTGPVEEFYDAGNPEELVYRLGMAAAQYYRNVIETQRRGRAAGEAGSPRICGGYLVWKFNDSWPQMYSGKVDYFLEPYISYYAIRRAFAPVMLSFEVGSHIWLWICNDSSQDVDGTVTVRLFHPGENRVRKQITVGAKAARGESRLLARLDQAGIGTFRREHILHAEFSGQGSERITTDCFLEIERKMLFPDARLTLQKDGDDLLVTADRFARAVVLTGHAEGESESDSQSGWFFSDNYFNLMPGEVKRIRILGARRKGRICAKGFYSTARSVLDYNPAG